MDDIEYNSYVQESASSTAADIDDQDKAFILFDKTTVKCYQPINNHYWSNTTLKTYFYCICIFKRKQNLKYKVSYRKNN